MNLMKSAGRCLILARRYTRQITYGLMLILAIWLTMFAVSTWDYRETVREIKQTNDQLVWSYEERVRRSLHAVEELIALVKAEYERAGVTPAVETIIQRARIYPLILQVMILDAGGDIVTSVEPGEVATNFRDRNYFKVHIITDMQKTFISEPIIGRNTGKQATVLSRRLNGPDGRFGGVVAVVLEPSFFSGAYQTMALQQSRIVRIVGQDGIIRESFGGGDSVVGEKMLQSDLFEKYVPHNAIGSYFTEGHRFGSARFFSYRSMPDYPLVLQVGIEAERALAEYSNRRDIYFGAAILGSLLILLVTGVSVMKTYQQQLVTKALNKNKLLYEKNRRQDALIAKRIQQAQLSRPQSSEYVKVHAAHYCCAEISGELYHIQWLNEGSLLRGYLVDVPGHGLTTALYASSLNVLLHEAMEMDAPLAEQVRFLNQQVCRHFEPGHFAAAIAFEVDLQLQELRYVGAGITNFWAVASQERGVVEAPGMYLGIDEEYSYCLQTLPLAMGDSIRFLTEGARNLLLRQMSDSAITCSQIEELLALEAKRRQLQDDATVLCIDILSLPQTMLSDHWPKVLNLRGYEDYRRMKGLVASILAEVTGLPHSMHEVAVNEAIANALECRDGIGRSQKARIKINCFRNRLVVRVKTSRIGFAGNAILRRLRANPEAMFAFGEDASMGRGIPMMLTMSDKMVYNGEGTEVLLSWKL